MPSIESRSRKNIGTFIEATKAYGQCLINDETHSVNGQPIKVELDMPIEEGFFAVTICPDRALGIHSNSTKFRIKKSNEGHSLFEVLGCTWANVTNKEDETYELGTNTLYQIPLNEISQIRTSSMGGFDLIIDVTTDTETNKPVLIVNRPQNLIK